MWKKFIGALKKVAISFSSSKRGLSTQVYVFKQSIINNLLFTFWYRVSIFQQFTQKESSRYYHRGSILKCIESFLVDTTIGMAPEMTRNFTKNSCGYKDYVYNLYFIWFRTLYILISKYQVIIRLMLSFELSTHKLVHIYTSINFYLKILNMQSFHIQIKTFDCSVVQLFVQR